MPGADWEPWAPILGALVFGIAIGWLIWGGARSRAADDEIDMAISEASGGQKDKAAPPAGAHDPCPAEMKLGAVESELRSARELLEETRDETASFDEELTGLEKTISRINGRIKVISRSINKARF